MQFCNFVMLFQCDAHPCCQDFEKAVHSMYPDFFPCLDISIEKYKYTTPNCPWYHTLVKAFIRPLLSVNIVVFKHCAPVSIKQGMRTVELKLIF